jgi:hypothetical protein
MEVKDELALHTGDILLFRSNTYISYILQYFGQSMYSHVGIILKNPSFLNSALEDGLYVLESSTSNTRPDAENNQYKCGVQIHRLDDILESYPRGSVFVRQVICKRDDAFYEKFAAVHKEIHNKPYDLNPCDWLMAKYNITYPLPINSWFHSTSKFWCSALVTYVFYELGLIEKDVNWSLVAPREFSSVEGHHLIFTCKINNEKNIY